jgi:hypothetical protein
MSLETEGRFFPGRKLIVYKYGRRFPKVSLLILSHRVILSFSHLLCFYSRTLHFIAKMKNTLITALAAMAANSIASAIPLASDLITERQVCENSPTSKGVLGGIKY